MDGEDYRSRLYDMLNRDPAAHSEGGGADGGRTQPVDSIVSPSNVSGDGPLAENQESQQVAVYPSQTEEREKAGKKKNKKKGKKNEKGDASQIGSQRGIETLFRTSYSTHMDLSALADNKANIMISINGIIVSVLLASISPNLDANTWLIVPTIMVLFSCLVSLSCAVLAALPRVSSKVVNLDDIRRRRGNLLFFGTFTRLSEEDYVQGMTEMAQNPPSLYHSMMRDIYGLGNVLARKFRLLRVAYITFMVGLILGVLMFVGVYIGIATVPPDVQANAPMQTPPAQVPFSPSTP
jgi:hypothetical protein